MSVSAMEHVNSGNPGESPCCGVDAAIFTQLSQQQQSAEAGDDCIPFPNSMFEEEERPTHYQFRFPVHPSVEASGNGGSGAFELPSICHTSVLNLETGKYSVVTGDHRDNTVFDDIHVRPISFRPRVAVEPATERDGCFGSGESELCCESAGAACHISKQHAALGELVVHICSHAAPADGTTDLSGYAVFPETSELGQFIVDNRNLFQGRRVLEVGAGRALPSHVALACGARNPVEVTDGCPSVIESCKGNAGLRPWTLLWQTDPEFARSPCTWPTDSAPIDIVIGSGVAYALASLRPLFETVRRLLASTHEGQGEQRKYFFCGFHDRQVSLQALLDCAASAGFEFCRSDCRGEKRGFPSTPEVCDDTHLGVYVFVLGTSIH